MGILSFNKDGVSQNGNIVYYSFYIEAKVLEYFVPEKAISAKGLIFIQTTTRQI